MCEAAWMQLKSAPGWLLDDRDLLDEHGLSIADAPPASSRKVSPKGIGYQTVSESHRCPT